MKDVINPPTGLLCKGSINPAGIMNNTPVFCWKHSGIGTEKGYRVLVASSVGALKNDSAICVTPVMSGTGTLMETIRKE